MLTVQAVLRVYSFIFMHLLQWQVFYPSSCICYNGRCFIKPLSQFTSNGHMCIVFKKLGLSLFDFLKYGARVGSGACCRVGPAVTAWHALRYDVAGPYAVAIACA